MEEGQKEVISKAIESGRVVHQYAEGSWGDSVHRIQFTSENGLHVVTGDWAGYDRTAILRFDEIADVIGIPRTNGHPESGILAWSEYWEGVMPRITIFTERPHASYVSEDVKIDWSAEREARKKNVKLPEEPPAAE